MEVNELLNYFEDKGVSIQITLSVGELPTVHALFKYEGEQKLLNTESDTLISSLRLMRDKYENHAL